MSLVGSRSWGYGILIDGGPGWFAEGPSKTRGSLRWEVGPSRSSGLPKDRSGSYWTLRHGDDSFYLRLDRSCTYRFDAAPTPRVRVSAEEWSPEEASIFFLMALLPFTLTRFDLQPFHGSAVTRAGEGALIIAGVSGAGKSTLLAELLERGATFLADDACGVDEDGLLWPGPPLFASRDLAPDPALPRYEGKAVLRPPRWGSAPLPVRATVVLEHAQGIPPSVEELDGATALRELMTHLRTPWLFSDGRDRLRLAALARVADGRVARIRFDPQLPDARGVGELVWEWLKAIDC